MARKTYRKAPAKTSVKSVSKTALAKTRSLDEIRFEIDQLRKDKIIYALESIAATLAALLFWVTLNINVPRELLPGVRNLYNLGFVIALLYWFLVAVGNTRRLMEIRKLGKLLKN